MNCTELAKLLGTRREYVSYAKKVIQLMEEKGVSIEELYSKYTKPIEKGSVFADAPDSFQRQDKNLTEMVSNVFADDDFFKEPEPTERVMTQEEHNAWVEHLYGGSIF